MRKMPCLDKTEVSDEQALSQQGIKIYQLIRRQIGADAMKQTLQPLWYRGLSETQLLGVHGLRRALGDDILQDTMHRSYRKLGLLGIVPPPPKRGMKLLLQFSRGNDVAFLWFLMQMFYKSDHHQVFYQPNEQIIMSAIFWLDLLPTLRELEKVLPPPQNSVKLQRQREHSQDVRRETQERYLFNKETCSLQNIQPKSNDINSPYFQKHIWPQPRFRRMYAERPRKEAQLPVFDKSQNPHPLYGRWFNNYEFNANERVARVILNREVDNIFSKMAQNKDEGAQSEVLCNKHKLIGTLEESLKLNLAKIKQEHCQLITKRNAQKQDRARQRVLKDLDRLTEKYTAQFQKMTKKEGCSSVRNPIILSPGDPGFVYIGDNLCDRGDDEVVCGLVDSRYGITFPDLPECLPPACQDHNFEKPEPTQCAKLNVLGGDARLWQCKASREDAQPGESPMQSDCTGMEEAMEKPKSSPQCQCSESKRYFELGTNADLYHFKYLKIFEASPCKWLANQKAQLRSYIRAFSEPDDLLDQVLDVHRGEAIDSLVTRSVKHSFQKGITRFNQRMAEKEKNLNQRTTRRLNLDDNTFDPDNIEVMKNLLRMGLDRVAQDRRFILPTLPDVHSVPLLLEWVRARYGKRFSYDERQRKLDKDKFLMNAVSIMLRKRLVQLPPRKTHGNLGKVSSFPPHNQNRQAVKQYWDQYTKNFALALLEVGRVFHSAMNAHTSTPSSARFHAYMPAQLRDLQLTNAR